MDRRHCVEVEALLNDLDTALVYVRRLTLPSQAPCLHAVAVGHKVTAEADSRLVWLAVSGMRPPTPQRSITAPEASCGPHSRLLSICSKKRVFLHNIDITSVLTSMISKCCC